MILLMETSHKLCSVAVCNLQGLVLWEYTDTNVFKHAEALPIAVNNAITFANNNIKAVAISAGPGSYTGLRIGTALATGFCYAKQLPFIAIPTLHAMANAVQTPLTKLAILHAIQTEYYTCIVKNNIPQPIQLLSQQQVESFANETTVIIGDCKNLFTNTTISQVTPVANLLAPMAAIHYASKTFTTLETFKPLYFKEFLPGISKKFKV